MIPLAWTIHKFRGANVFHSASKGKAKSLLIIPTKSVGRDARAEIFRWTLPQSFGIDGNIGTDDYHQRKVCMATTDELKIWLEVARNLAPEAGLVALAFSLVYLARHTWRTREDWRLGPPWRSGTRYIKMLHAAFAYTRQLDLVKSCALYIFSSQPEAGKRFNPNEAYDLESLMSLAVHERKIIVLTGVRASGKTVFLHTLALRANSAEFHRKLGFAKAPIPFYIPIKHLILDLPFVPALALALKTSGFPLYTFQIKRALRRGHALILFDGMEDLADKSQRQAFVSWLEKARTHEVGNTQLVIASRTETWLVSMELRAAHFLVGLRNFSQKNQRTLSAVTETRMPAIFRNPVEAEAEYVLVPPPPDFVMLSGAKKFAPRYHYHLAKFPITNRSYRVFVQAHSHREPLFWREKDFAGSDLPVVGIDWEDAERYCEWLNQMLARGKHEGFIFRLPLEEEWEWAASGIGRRIYPWGNDEPTKLHANFGENNAQLTSVYAHSAGATPEGVREMAGNVWEWTATAINAKPEKRIVRGGAAFNEASVLQCLARDSHAKERSRFVGVRVVRIPI